MRNINVLPASGTSKDCWCVLIHWIRHSCPFILFETSYFNLFRNQLFHYFSLCLYHLSKIFLALFTCNWCFKCLFSLNMFFVDLKWCPENFSLEAFFETNLDSDECTLKSETVRVRCFPTTSVVLVKAWKILSIPTSILWNWNSWNWSQIDVNHHNTSHT